MCTSNRSPPERRSHCVFIEPRLRFVSRQTSEFDDDCMRPVTNAQLTQYMRWLPPNTLTHSTHTFARNPFRRSVSSPEFLFLPDFRFFLLRFCSLLFVALLCSVHSTQLCKTRRRRRRHRRRHRTFSRFNCKCFRIVLCSLEARGTAFPLHPPRVPRNYDIVLNRVCAMCMLSSLVLFFFPQYSAVVGCGNVLFARENDFLRFSVIFILSFGFGSSHKSNARIYGSERSTTHTHTHRVLHMHNHPHPPPSLV